MAKIVTPKAFGPPLGFLWGWAMFWIMHSGIIAAIAVIFARYAAFFLPLDDLGVRFVAVAAVLVISAVNWIGVRQGSALQTGLTLLAVAPDPIVVTITNPGSSPSPGP